MASVPPIVPAVPDDCPGLDDCGNAGPIHDQIADLSRGQKVLTKGHDVLVQQMAEIVVTMREQDRKAAEMKATLAAQDLRIDANAASLTRLQKLLDENNKMTADSAAMLSSIAGTVETIRDMQAAGRLGVRLARWAKSGIGWIVAVGTGVAAIWHFAWPKK